MFKPIGSLATVTALLAIQNVQAYQGSAASDRIDFETFELAGDVKDILWCGSRNEAMLVQTSNGQIYRSRDSGASWKRLSNQMQGMAQQVADKGQQFGKVHKMVQSPVDDSVLVFLGTNGINWISEDCGGNMRALNSGKKIQSFTFHPLQRDWALATSWTSCVEFGDEPCKIYKELYLTRNLGQEWNYLTNYVFDYEWGSSKFAKDEGVKIPDERIFVTRDSTNDSNQKIANKWSVNINLYESDNFFQDSRMLVEAGNTIVKTDQFMFVAKSHEDEKRVNIFSSSYKSGFSYIRQVIMPPDAHLGNTFTIMDTSESQVFMFLQNHGSNTQMGNLYISDAEGHSFSLSMENVIQGSSVDFERVQSLDGTFIVNRYDSEHRHDAKSNNGRPDFRSTINEFELYEQEEEKESMDQTRMGGSMNKKQRQTRSSVIKGEEKLSGSQLQTNVRSYITHNKGGSWELIRAPTRTSKNKLIDCYIEDNCSLNLEIYSAMGELSPIYSTESAVGIVLGTGNLGKNLTPNGNAKNLYLSRDGGLNWQSVMPGEYIYEIGDHGALIIVAQINKPTRQVKYTWDEGKTWQSFDVFKSDVMVKNIVMEPTSTSQQFLIYGTTKVKKSVDVKSFESDDAEDDSEAAMIEESVIASIDFSLLHEPQCKGIETAGEADSDYELWSPYDGRHGSNTCFLGQQVTYVRRKQSSACYNGEDMERSTQRVPCDCTEMDYECDIGYFRAGQGGSCAEESENITKEQKNAFVLAQQEDQCKETGSYLVSQGYRKIPGDICTAGVDLNPYSYKCGSVSYISSLFSFKGMLFTAALVAICYYGWPIIEAIIIVMPVPDPEEIKDKLRYYAGKVSDKTGELIAKARGMASSASSGAKDDKGEYTGSFDQIPSMMDEEDQEDMDDVGLKPSSMSYNDGEEDDEEQPDMIKLDESTDESSLQQKKKVKKLPKPNKK